MFLQQSALRKIICPWEIPNTTGFSTKYSIILALLLVLPTMMWTQEENHDPLFIKQIYNEALENGQCYSWLEGLTKGIGGRLSGSPQAAAAITYTKSILDSLKLDSVWLQPCLVPKWTRGATETAKIVNHEKIGTVPLNVLALGNSPATKKGGLSAEIVLIDDFDELSSFSKEDLSGKIAFFNQRMDPTQFNTFNAYGAAVASRVFGPAKAAEKGAVASIVRSLTTQIDHIPHTGVTVFDSLQKKIPAFAISTKDANLLASLVQESEVKVFLNSNCKIESPTISYNVIGEIRGSTFPDEWILVGGHLDSWDVGEGAHDDGAGCVQAMEAINLLTQNNYTPKRSIRCVLFMNEENGLAGATKYAQTMLNEDVYHLAAIESDAGGFSPRAFSCDGLPETFNMRYKQFYQWLKLLEPYGITFTKGGSGADINPLKPFGGLLIGLRPDNQRYFDYHHTSQDILENVNERELKLGAAAMSSIIYLIDKHGLGKRIVIND